MMDWRRALILALPASVVLYYLWLFLSVLPTRLMHPYELEWMEGSGLQYVLRILDGGVLYDNPSMDYTPLLYTPLYYYLAALFAKFTGVNFVALRLVSILATAATMFVTGYTVWKITRDRIIACYGALSWAAFYAYSGFWYDVARVDSLWTFFLACTVLCISLPAQDKRLSMLSAGIFFSLATCTKQTSLFVLPFLFLSILLLRSLHDALTFGLSCAIATAIAFLIFQFVSGDLFFFYTMQMAGAHEIRYGMTWERIYTDILITIPVYSVLCLMFCWQQQWQKRLGWLVLLGGFAAMSIISRIYSGGYFNVLMPLYMVVAITSACGLQVLLGMAGKPGNGFAVALLLSVLLALNGKVNDYPVDVALPTAEDVRFGDALVARLAQVEGKVCPVDSGYLGYLAGKNFCAHHLALTDLLYGSDKELADKLRTDIQRKVATGYYSVLLLMGDGIGTLTQLGVIDAAHAPYSVTPIAYRNKREFKPVVSGPRPEVWLEYSGNNPPKAAETH